MEFKQEQNRIYLNDENNKTVAYVTFPELSGKTVIIDHTYVDDSLRGQGVAGKLMEEVVSQLRKSDRKARLSCSYAVAWFERHPEASDVLESHIV